MRHVLLMMPPHTYVAAACARGRVTQSFHAITKPACARAAPLYAAITVQLGGSVPAAAAMSTRVVRFNQLFGGSSGGINVFGGRLRGVVSPKLTL